MSLRHHLTRHVSLVGTLEGRELWGWRIGLGQVTATGAFAALPPSLGAGRPATSGRRAHPAPAGRGPRVPRRQPKARPRPSCRNSRLGPPGLVGGPYGRRPRRDETLPGNLPAAGVARRVPRADNSCHAPGRRQRTPGFTNRSVPAWLGRAGTRPPPRPARQPQRENRQHPKRASTASRGTGYTDPEIPSTPSQKPKPPVEGWRHTHTHTTPPTQTPRAGH